MATASGGQRERSLAQTVMRDGAVYATAGLLSHGIAFLLFPFFAHVFEPRDYGIIDLLGIVMTLVNLTVALEVSQGVARHIADARDHADRVGYASTAFLFTVGCYSAFAALALAFAPALTDLILGSDVEPGILRVAVGAMWCYGLSYLTIDLLRWQLRPKAFALCSVTMAAVVAATSAIFVLVLDLGVRGALLGQLCGFATGGALAFVLGRDVFRLRFDRERLRRMLSYSLPLVPASAGVFLAGYADRVAIQAQSTLADVGLYGVGYRLSLIVSLALMGFQGALLPRVLSRHAEEGTPLELARVFRLFCAVALTIFIVVSTFSDELLRILTPPAYYSAERVVPFTVAGAFFAGMYVFAPGMNIAKRTRPVAVIMVISGVANLALALALVPVLGIVGAGTAFAVASFAGFSALMRTSQRHYRAPHQWPRLIRAALLATAITIAGWRLPASSEHLWALPVKLALVAGGVALLAALLLDADERAMGREGLRGLAVRLRRRGRR